jgi:UDP-N-acetylmuramate dehydrogenase
LIVFLHTLKNPMHKSLVTHEHDLPRVRGRYSFNAPLGAVGWFRCGGAADILFKPEDEDDLAHFLKECPRDMPVTVLGVLSNTIVRDGGVRGVVVRMGRGFTDIHVSGTAVRVGAAALDINVATTAMEHGVAGLEFLSGVPGSIGGALRMNAGAYGREIKDVLITAHGVTRAGEKVSFTPSAMGMSYRHCDVPEDVIFTQCELRGIPDDKDAIAARMHEIKTRREESQPIKSQTGGSTFANPSPQELEAAGLPPDTKTWWLIDQVGGRGLKCGGAQMSEKHTNFMINTGNATAADLENLGEDVKRRVLDRFGIVLRWEIRRIGEAFSPKA